ncbi:MAG: PAS domain-containing sensor histidine kinase [Pseudomonadota bacterium]
MNSPFNSVQSSSDEKPHYLKVELDALVRQDTSIFEFIQAGSLDGIWYWDLDAPEHEWMSPRFWETLGYDASQRRHLASEWQTLIHPDDLALAIENFERHCQDPTHPYDQLVRYRHAAGHQVTVRCRGIAIRDAEGRPVRMLGAHQDVTELVQAREEKSRLLEQARVLNDELSLFSYAASHDLQSPLKSLRGLLALFKAEASELQGTTAAETLEQIEAAVSKLQQLTDAVLHLADLQSLELARSNVDLHQLCREAINELELEFTMASAIVRCTVSGTAFVNAVLVRQALKNLLVNSLRYATPGQAPVIDLSGGVTTDEAWLLVQDNGVGIAPDEREAVFDLFRRGARGGHGLGLAVVKKVAERHGGDVRVEASEVGARIRLRFPAPRSPTGFAVE